MTQLGEAKEITLSAGTIRYRERGHGRPLLFVHGLLVHGGLWRKVVPLLADDHRCITPDWPLGSHTPALNRDADLTPTGIAALIAEFIEKLELDDVVVVGNDTGGALCQILVTRHPQRIGGLVLASCDSYENFLPLMFRYLQLAARIPGGLFVLLTSLRIRPMRKLPIAFGWLAHGLEREASDSYLAPAMNDRGVRRDAGKVLRGISRRYTLEAAEQLGGFDRPALMAWGAEDRFFPLEHGRRLAEQLPQGTFTEVAGSRSFVPEDQPARLADLIGAFAAKATAAA